LTSTWGYGRLAAGSPTSPQATIHRCYAAEDPPPTPSLWSISNAKHTENG